LGEFGEFGYPGEFGELFAMILVFLGSEPLRGPSGVDDLRRKDGAEDEDAAFARLERATLGRQ
jgi:hypothetical protein